MFNTDNPKQNTNPKEPPSIGLVLASLITYALIGVVVFGTLSSSRMRMEVAAAERARTLWEITECFATTAIVVKQDAPYQGQDRNQASPSHVIPSLISRCRQKIMSAAAEPTWSQEPDFTRLLLAVDHLPDVGFGESASLPLAAQDANGFVPEQLAGQLENITELAGMHAARAAEQLDTIRLATPSTLGSILSLYLLGLLAIKYWAGACLIRPIRALIAATNRAAEEGHTLGVPVTGPREMRDMIQAVSSYVESLRDDARDSNERLNVANQKLRLVNATLTQTRHDAYHDGLTRLPNRYLLRDRIRQLLERSKRDRGFRFAVLFIDLDNFKNVNDSLGHSAGDVVLAEVARRVAALLRSLDTVSRPVANTAARIGGDEFVILLQDIHSVADAVRVAERLQEALTDAMWIGGHQIGVTASIGITVSDGLRLDEESLLRDADTAMYRAKQAGKVQYVVFSPSMHTDASRRFTLENQLRVAMNRDELRLCYQPIVSLDDGLIHGFEALIRWHHPDDGLIPPDEFIPLAEETGLILPIGEWVLQTACGQLRQWCDALPTCQHLTMSVNVSRRQLDAPGFSEMLRGILSTHNLEARQLNLELTEGVILDTTDQIVELLGELKRMGVNIHLDDFGTGYSTLGCLQKFPIDVLKLDRSFVQAIGDGRKDASIVSGIHTMARNLGMRIVAEGIEDNVTLAALIALDCDMGQGYYFSKPLDAAGAQGLLRTGGHWRAPATLVRAPEVLLSI